MKMGKGILVDLWHPAHFHYSKHAITELEKRGHRVHVTCKRKDILIGLLNQDGRRHTVLWNGTRSGILYHAFVLLVYTVRLLRYVRKHEIGILIGSSPAICLVASLTGGARSVLLIEDDAAVLPLLRPFYFFTDYLLTPESLKEDHGRNHIKYPSYHELAYLHPNQFTPDSSILDRLNVRDGERYFVVRLSLLHAHHDLWERGLSERWRRSLLEMLESRGRVFITMEGDLDEELSRFRLPVPIDQIHDVLYHASLYIGDSQTMALEAALLGTPAIRCNSFVGRLSVLEELEHKYQLTFGFLPSEERQMLRKIEEILNLPDPKSVWRSRVERLLADKVDFCEYLVRFVESIDGLEGGSGSS